MRLLLLILMLASTGAAACTSFLLEDEGELYFVHSLNQGSMDRVDGAAYINPRGAWKEGYGFAALFDPADESGPGLAWRSRYGSVTFSPLGKEMPDGGLNEAGLFIWEMGFDTVYPEARQRPVLFQMQWMQYQLDNHATVDEVLASLDRVTLDGWGWHYFIADADGRAAILDFPDGRPEVHRGADLPIPLSGNAYYPEALRWLREHEGQGGELAWRDEHHEIPRFATGARMLEAFGDQDPVTYAFDILQAMSVNVRWSVVFDLSRGTAHFSTNVDPEPRRFSFDPEDFRPGATPLRLDIDSSGPGDLRSRFVPCGPEADLAVLADMLELITPEGTDRDALARKIIARLTPSHPSLDEEIAGSWSGTLQTSAGKASGILLDLREDASLPAGTCRLEASDRPLPLLNPRWRGGLLDFVLELPGDGDRLRFQLHRCAEGWKGSARSWNWERQTPAAVELARPAP